MTSCDIFQAVGAEILAVLAFNQPLFRAKVRDHCHNFGKYKDPALRDGNIKGKLNHKIQHQRSSNPKAQYQT